MATYASDIDRSESPGLQGARFSCVVGSGGVTAGQPVKYTTTSRTVVACSAATDVCVGVAATAQSEGSEVTVLGPGCLVKVPYTLTGAGKVGLGAGGDAGKLVDYSSGTVVGVVETSATLASVVRVNIQY